MAESDAGEKQYDPFPQQVKERRRQGQVWQSRELSSLLVFVAGIAIVAWRVGPAFEALRDSTFRLIHLATSAKPDIRDVLTGAGAELDSGLRQVVPFLLALTIIGALVPFLQVGPLLTLTPLTPRIRFTDALKRMFGKEAFGNLFKTLVKMILIGVAGYLAVRDSLPNILRLGDQPIERLPGVTMNVLKPLFTRGLCILAAFALVDVFLQRRKYHKNMKISAAELKEQSKQYDANPEIKGRQRAMYRSLVEARMYVEAPTGQLMVEGPPQTCCILRFDPKKENAPRLIAKGQGKVGARLKQIAKNKGMYAETDRSLAKALLGLKLRTEIPVALYAAAAEVLKWAARHYEDRGQAVPWESVLKEAAAAQPPESPARSPSAFDS